jgi:hypothetical protein
MRKKEIYEVNNNAVLTETLPYHLLMTHNRLHNVKIEIKYLNMTTIVAKSFISI